MKAVVLEGPDVYTVKETERPVCDPEGILLKVMYCGLCGSDLRTLRSGHKNIPYPAIIGHEVSGEVVELGREYRGVFKTGDRLAVAPNVYCGKCEFCLSGRHEYCDNLRELAQRWPGGFAEYMAIPPEALKLGTIQPVPPGLAMEHACVAEPPSSCLNAQEKLGIGLGDVVLIIGAGPIGSIHTAIARVRGAGRIIIADIKDSRLEMAKRFGADDTVNSSAADMVQTVRDITGGKGPDVVITANPFAETQVQAIELAKKSGRIAFFGGLPHGNSTVPIDTNKIHYKGLSVMGTTGFAPRHHILSLDLMAQGKIPGDKLVTHIMDIDDFAKGVKLAAEGLAMKVVYKMRLI
jgi:L-iditol 2-dehydrogenase